MKVWTSKFADFYNIWYIWYDGYKIYVGVEEVWRIHIWTIHAEAGKPPRLAFLSSRLSFLFSSCSSTTMASWLGGILFEIKKNRPEERCKS